MLERAKACLRSGARETLRCPHPTPRSKRMLHSTFWNHGAGDLDLPPWALLMSPISLDLHLKSGDSLSCDRSLRKEQDRTVATSENIATDGVHLDFLYPPQALSRLRQSASYGHNRERWERRNAKRLPEGFIQASRGFASRSATQGTSSQAISNDREEDLDRADTRHGDDDTNFEPKALHVEGTTPYGFDHSPADVAVSEPLQTVNLSESSGSPPTVGPDVGPISAERLYRMFSASRENRARYSQGKTGSPTTPAWSIYEALDDETKNDVRLKAEMLCHMASQENETTYMACVTLYHSIPVEERTLPVYQAALSVFLQRNMYVEAVKLHEEATRTLQNGDQVTKAFFRAAVERRKWKIALQIEAHHRLAFAAADQAPKRAMFWVNLSEIPQLLAKAFALSRFLRTRNQAYKADQATRTFAANFYKEALAQEFQAPHHEIALHSFSATKELNPKLIQTLYKGIVALGSDAPKIFEDLLTLMVQPNSRMPYHRMHGNVSYLYHMLRNFEQYRMPQTLLMTLLERVTRYNDNLQRHDMRGSIKIWQLTRDWRRYHGQITRQGVMRLLSYYAHGGQQEEFERWMVYFKSTYPAFSEWKGLLWMKIYLYARTATLPKAKDAFKEAEDILAEHREAPDLYCWNVLLHAQSRGDDLDGALKSLQSVIEQGLRPDEFTFHPVLELLAKRGDVEAIQDLLVQYDKLAHKKREVAFFGSLLHAYIRNGQVGEAEKTLRQLLQEVRTGKVRGSLTRCFNIVLTAHALRKDLSATISTYRWMKTEGIHMNSETYASLMQVLAFRRQTNAAYKILQKTMRRSGVEATAFHYGIIMAGYINQDMYDHALAVHADMRELNIKSTFSTNAAFLRAKAMEEHKTTQRSESHHLDGFLPLNTSVADLKRVLTTQGAELAAKQPQLGLGALSASSLVPAGYLDFLIDIHGKRQCFEAVRELYQEYKTYAVQRESGRQEPQPPIRLLAALMGVHLRRKDFEEVEKCWNMAKEYADENAPLLPVAALRKPFLKKSAQSDVLDSWPMPAAEDAQVAGLRTDSELSDTREQSAVHGPQGQQTEPIVDEDSPSLSKPSTARAHIITRPLRIYIYALAAQSRARDMINVVSQYLLQGYKMDNLAWNGFIQHLCRAAPPLTLLAFTLTERFLIPQFPGWTGVGAGGYSNKSAKKEELQFIRARYLRPGILLPQYPTLVHLGAALLALRRIDATGRPGHLDWEGFEDLGRYVGTTKQVRAQAPMTVFAVQSMPKVDDWHQRRFLRKV